jgi:peptidoglycan hydrolase-like protein with peptidoglycan-binding domain
MAVKKNLKFKDFTWPHNPASFNMSYENRVIRHEFPDFWGAETEDFKLGPRVFSGSGAFIGGGAWYYFTKLSNMAFYNSPGVLEHPVYGKFLVRLTKLTSREEPTPDYVEYDFEFIEHKEINILTKLGGKKPGGGSGGSGSGGSSTSSHKHGIVKRGAKGDEVKEIQKVVGVTADGVFGPKTESAVKAFQKRYGIKPVDGIVGPSTWAKIHAIMDASSGSKTTTRYYTVVSGDTLGKISKKYYGTTTKWKKIADANKNLIKNPSSLKIGWKLVIPY